MEHRSIVVRALAFGAGGPRFKSRRGKIFPTQTRIFILSNQKRVCSAIDEKNESAQKDDAGNRRAIV